jgi:hypothetical protein
MVSLDLLELSKLLLVHGIASLLAHLLQEAVGVESLLLHAVLQEDNTTKTFRMRNRSSAQHAGERDITDT